MVIEISPWVFAHKILSILTVSFVFLAGCQALLIGLQEHALRQRREFFLLSYLPPLQSAEKSLFRLLYLSFVFLTLLLVSSFYAFSPLPSYLVTKVVFSIVAWFVFAALLGGHHYYGWRGLQAVRWTLLGLFFILICAVFMGVIQ